MHITAIVGEGNPHLPKYGFEAFIRRRQDKVDSILFVLNKYTNSGKPAL